jgi:hypothetical protein
MTKKLVFTGCSFTAGSGWDKNVTKNASTTCKDYPGLWVNLCYKNITDFSELELVNLAQNGASNNEIFQQTLESSSILGSDIHNIFCQWTSMPRYNFNAGFELWNTSESFSELYDLTHELYYSKMDYIKENFEKVLPFNVNEDWLYDNYLKSIVTKTLDIKNYYQT